MRATGHWLTPRADVTENVPGIAPAIRHISLLYCKYKIKCMKCVQEIYCKSLYIFRFSLLFSHQRIIDYFCATSPVFHGHDLAPQSRLGPTETQAVVIWSM